MGWNKLVILLSWIRIRIDRILCLCAMCISLSIAVHGQFVLVFFKIVAIAEPLEHRRKNMGEEYGITQVNPTTACVCTNYKMFLLMGRAPIQYTVHIVTFLRERQGYRCKQLPLRDLRLNQTAKDKDFLILALNP